MTKRQVTGRRSKRGSCHLTLLLREEWTVDVCRFPLALATRVFIFTRYVASKAIRQNRRETFS